MKYVKKENLSTNQYSCSAYSRALLTNPLTPRELPHQDSSFSVYTNYITMYQNRFFVTTFIPITQCLNKFRSRNYTVSQL